MEETGGVSIRFQIIFWNLSPRFAFIPLNTEKETSMKTIVKLAIALGFMSAVTACNTIDGVGKDVEVAGEEIQDAAD